MAGRVASVVREYQKKPRNLLNPAKRGAQAASRVDPKKHQRQGEDRTGSEAKECGSTFCGDPARRPDTQAEMFRRRWASYSFST